MLRPDILTTAVPYRPTDVPIGFHSATLKTELLRNVRSMIEPRPALQKVSCRPSFANPTSSDEKCSSSASCSCRQLRHVGRCISRKSSWPQDERKYVAEEKKKEKRAKETNNRNSNRQDAIDGHVDDDDDDDDDDDVHVNVDIDDDDDDDGQVEDVENSARNLYSNSAFSWHWRKIILLLPD
ncbi:hypothetical protein ACLKA6_008267 [Drosophila palustris]